jgi:hypothetical protein
MNKKPEPFIAKDSWPTLLLVAICVVLILSMVILMIVLKSPTPVENGLTTFILTAASSVISYLISKMFAEKGFDQVMRDHGVQIARGLMELKNQIGNLSDWVGTKRAFLVQNGSSSEAIDYSLEHVELTLQGFRGLADNAVGGIAGVIGDAYSQYEDFIDEVGNIRSEAQVKTSQLERSMETAVSPIDFQKIQEQINDIATQTERKITQLAKTVSLPIPLTPIKRLFSIKCPNCSHISSLEMIDRAGETKPMLCNKCGKRFNAHLSATGEIFTGALYPGSPSLAAKVSGEWANENNIQAEVKMILQRMQAFADPGMIDEIARFTVKHDQELKRLGGVCTPLDLQVKVLTDPAKTFTGVAARAFFKMVFLGNGFVFADENNRIFKSPYSNILTEAGLFAAFARGTVNRLAAVRPIANKHTIDLAKALFGDDAVARQPIVAEAVSLALRRSNSEGEKN